MKHLMLVCTGNICRSPLAMGVFENRLGASVQVTSMGLHALEGRPADPYAIETARNHGVDISKHRARQISESEVKRADLVLVMESHQSNDLLRRFPWATGRVWRLGQQSNTELFDLLGKPITEFESFFQATELAFKAWEPVLRS